MIAPCSALLAHIFNEEETQQVSLADSSTLNMRYIWRTHKSIQSTALFSVHVKNGFNKIDEKIYHVNTSNEAEEEKLLSAPSLITIETKGK